MRYGIISEKQCRIESGNFMTTEYVKFETYMFGDYSEYSYQHEGLLEELLSLVAENHNFTFIINPFEVNYFDGLESSRQNRIGFVDNANLTDIYFNTDCINISKRVYVESGILDNEFFRKEIRCLSNLMIQFLDKSQFSKVRGTRMAILAEVVLDKSETELEADKVLNVISVNDGNVVEWSETVVTRKFSDELKEEVNINKSVQKSEGELFYQGELINDNPVVIRYDYNTLGMEQTPRFFASDFRSFFEFILEQVDFDTQREKINECSK